MDSSRPDGGLSLNRRAAAIAVALLLCVPSSGAAQTTDDYWRALRSETDAAIVLAASPPSGIPEEIGAGLRLFRAWELTGDEGSGRAARELLRRARVAPEHRAWHALALAMVYARGPDSSLRINEDGDRVIDPGSMGSARSLRLLRSALEARPDFREAALELARWALDRGHQMVAAEAEVALTDLPQDAEILVTRASLNLAFDQPAFAAELAARAQQAGADVSVARHARAWALMQYGPSSEEAVRLYYLGAEQLTDAGRAEYTRMLEPVLSPDEWEEWREVPNDSAAQWLRRYWASNAARAGVLPEERLAEHYRRLHRARIDYPNTAPLSVLQQQARFVIREDSRRFNLSLRGLMLVRHGDAFRLAHIEPCLSNPWPTVGGAATICSELGPNRLAVFQQVTRLARGDSYFPFVRPIDLLYGVYAFRGARGTNDVVFAVGLPARSANALIDGPDYMRGLLSAVILADSGTYYRSDSTFTQPVPRFADPLAGETDAVTLLFGVLSAPAEEATREFRVTISDVERHAGGIGRGEITTHEFDDFSVSDVVVAPESMPRGWSRGDLTVAFAPLATYQAGEVVTLYYEVYGLAEGAQFETEVELAPPATSLGERLLDLVRDRSVRFRFDGVATAPDPVHGLQQQRTITLEGVEAGIYAIRVRVTDTAAGRTTLRETRIQVAE